MKVEVQLFATLAPYLPPGGEPAFVDVAPGATVTDLIRALAIPDAMPRIVLVNGRDADDTERLRPGDVVSVFPPLAGGATPKGATIASGRLERLIEDRRAEASRNPVGLPDFKSGVRL